MEPLIRSDHLNTVNQLLVKLDCLQPIFQRTVNKKRAKHEWVGRGGQPNEAFILGSHSLPRQVSWFCASFQFSRDSILRYRVTDLI